MDFKPQRFLSLKWKALYLSTCLFVLLTAGFLLSGKTYIDRQFAVKRENATLQYQLQLDVLVEQSAQRLQQLAATISSFEAMEDAIISGKGEQIEEAFDRHWWKFEIDGAVDSAAFYNVDGTQMVAWGVSGSYQAILEKIIETQAPAWEVNCVVTCQILAGIPLLIDGRFETLIIFSTSFTDIILNFQAITGADIGVVAVNDAGSSVINTQDGALPYSTHGRIERDTDEPEEAPYVPLANFTGWLGKLVSITEIQHNRPLLQAFSKDVDTAPALGERTSFSWRDLDYELIFLPIIGARYSGDNRLVIITNVAEDVQAASDLFRNTFLGALFGLVISELVLLSILWKPTTELQKVVDALPKLAENDFDAARHSFKASVSDKLVTDESDVLKSTALSLSYQLEALHSLLNNRASQLESRGLELETERNFVLGLLNTAHALILTQNSRGEVLMINQHGKKLLGLEADVAEGTNFASLLHGRDEIQLIVQQLQELQQGLVEDVHHESPMMNEHGQPRFMSWFHSRLPERGEEGHDILTVAIDISERRQAEDNLGWLASHDPLTGLVNRRRFEDELEQVMAASRRYGHAGAVFFLDLDQFKDVNDSSGHQIGDEMLKRVADALVGSASNADIVSRLGGDEFAVLVHECDEMQAGELAEKFCRSLIKIAVPGVKRIHRISCSIGVALFPRHGEGQSEILSNADIAMYQAKDAGRNTWSIFNEDEFGKERIQERVYWNDRVKNILNGETFEVFFQPIVRISDGFSSHYEALLRIYNEEQQLVGPQQFIEAAERGGLMPQVDEKVITKVLSALKELNQQGVNARVSINLSGLSFRNENLLEHIASGLKKFSVDPHSVIFEITETAAVSDIDVAVGLMSKIRKMGCQFALDDFGVGFSSLHYLKQLPVDYLKIDGSFIQAIHKRRDDRILVKALVDIASEFGQFTVAEFVDTPEALAVLKDLRVDYAQGYYVGKPMPLSALLES